MARMKGVPPLYYQLLVYPVTNFAHVSPSCEENADGYFITKKDLLWFRSHYLNGDADRDNPYASPLRARSLFGLPPAMVVTAEFNPLRDDGEDLRCQAPQFQHTCRPYEIRWYDSRLPESAFRAGAKGKTRGNGCSTNRFYQIKFTTNTSQDLRIRYANINVLPALATGYMLVLLLKRLRRRPNALLFNRTSRYRSPGCPPPFPGSPSPSV